jgi:hypothetical protein
MEAPADPTGQPGQHPFGPDAAAILATEHWSLLGTRSLTGHHDDERGMAASYLLAGPRELRPWAHFLVTTPTIVATVDAALAAAIVVLVAQALEVSTAAAVAAGAVAFAGVWGGLLPLQRQNLGDVRDGVARFPSPPG